MSVPAKQKGKRAPYPAYKPCSIEWLGLIPKHWEVKRLRRLVDCLDGRRIPLNSEQRGQMQGKYPYWGANGVVDHLNEWLFNEPLVLLGEDGAPFFKKFHKVAFLVIGKVWVNNHIHVLRVLPNVEARFLTHGLNSTDYTAFVDGTTRDKLTQDKMNDIPIALPPIPEQKAIAAFLDRETARIDALIEKKRRQIELLQEKRAALISHSVTKGLDPNAPMKDSGIEWLGQIPAHWKAVSLKRYLRVSSGDMISVNDFCEEGYPVFGGNGFRGYSDRWNTESDTIIIGRYGALCGNVRVTEERIWATEHAFRVIPLAAFHVNFLAAVIESLDLNRLSARTAQPGLNSEMVRNNVVGIPPISEQLAITAFLYRQTKRIDTLIGKVNDSIVCLHEYRTSLISAAVTGKIDVRAEEAPA